MKTIINELTIKNFKSIKEVKLDCKQVNIFIGKPNTGKSNILEAISLFSDGVLMRDHFFYEGSIFYEKIDDLFYNQDRSNIISVESDIGSVQLSFFRNEENFGYFSDTSKYCNLFEFIDLGEEKDVSKKSVELKSMLKYTSIVEAIQDFRELNNPLAYFGAELYWNGSIPNLTDSSSIRLTPVRSYKYSRNTNYNNSENKYLQSPHGNNLWGVLQKTPKLSEIAGEFFKQFGLDLVLVSDEDQKKIKIQKKYGGVFIHLPYSLVADTLQRMIFHLAAIYSNKDAVILFEEPEAHTYAPYQSYLASEIIEDEQNQYFITTHSDLIFDSIVREKPDKVAVFIVGYDGSNTTVRPLTKDEITDQLNNYTSIFQNLDKYDNHES